MDLEGRINKINDFIKTSIGEKKALVREYKELKVDLKQSKKELKRLQKAHELLGICSEYVQEMTKNKIEEIVTEGLRRVFDKDIEFVLQMEIKRGKMSATPLLKEKVLGKERISNIKDSRGCGVADIISFILNIVFLVLKSDVPKIFIADEPFKFVSRDYLPRVAELLVWLRDLTGIQFIIVTHKSEFTEIADKVFEISQDKNGMSKVREV